MVQITFTLITLLSLLSVNLSFTMNTEAPTAPKAEASVSAAKRVSAANQITAYSLQAPLPFKAARRPFSFWIRGRGPPRHNVGV